MDALTIILSAHHKDWWGYYAIMATIGAVVGGYMTYALARKGGKEGLPKKLPKKKAEQVHKTFEKYGFWSLFVPALLPPPVPFSPFLIAAGALNYSPRRFLLALGTARGIRYCALAYLGSSYSRQIFGFSQEYYKPILWTLLTFAVIGVIAAAIYFWKRKRVVKPVSSDTKNRPAKIA